MWPTQPARSVWADCVCVCVGLGTTGEKYAYCVTVWDPCVRGWHRQNMLMSASACVLAEACHLILWCCSLYVQQCGSHSLLLYSPLISSPQGNVCVHIYFYFLYNLCTVNTSITSVQIYISDIQYMVMCFGTLVVGVCADVPLSCACLMWWNMMQTEYAWKIQNQSGKLKAWMWTFTHTNTHTHTPPLPLLRELLRCRCSGVI